jgi:hypothetical protein
MLNSAEVTEMWVERTAPRYWTLVIAIDLLQSSHISGAPSFNF